MTAICFVLLCTVVICMYAIWRSYIYIETTEAKVAEYKRLAEATIKARGSLVGCWADKAGTQSIVACLAPKGGVGMKEYISREAAIKAVSDDDYEGYATWAIKSITAADVREVVLCRDCVYANKDEHGLWCFNDFENCLSEDDFCSHGKRRGADMREAPCDMKERKKP